MAAKQFFLIFLISLFSKERPRGIYLFAFLFFIKSPLLFFKKEGIKKNFSFLSLPFLKGD